MGLDTITGMSSTGVEPAGTLPVGRWAQRERTRRALLEAAGELVGQGLIPTVAQVAEHSQISRSTAYRYFPTQESLLVEVSLPFSSELSTAFAQARRETDVATRVGIVVRAAAEWCFDHQEIMREMQRASLDSDAAGDGYARTGHRRDWIEEMLAPVREDLDELTYRRLSANLSLYFGIDAIVVMHNVNGLTREDAIDALVWGATALVAVTERTAQ